VERYSDIIIDPSFVIHVLDNRLPTVQCSQALTPLPAEFRTTLETYLLALLKPAFRRKHFGSFRPESPVLQAYQRLAASARTPDGLDPRVFLEVSQELASRLFTTMRQVPHNGTRQRPGEITPGDLLVGTFSSAPPALAGKPALFLLKVDLEAGLQRQVRPLATGGMQTVLTPCEGLLPKLTAAHIHKSAIIQYDNDPTTYDVLMTDPQGGKEGIAKFFAEDFLHTEPFQTPEQQVELLFMRTHDWVTAHAEDLSPKEQEEVIRSVRTLITERAARAEPIVPRDLVITLPLLDPRSAPALQELRQSFQDTLTASEAQGPPIPLEEEFRVATVPPRVARRRVVYQLDHGVQLSGEQEALERLFAQPPHRVGSSTEFTIRTTTFRPVL
jgi:37-kD nucleoid-associated bacterial protein